MRIPERIIVLAAIVAVSLTSSGSFHSAAPSGLVESAVVEEEVSLDASADTYVQGGSANRNAGGAQLMRVQPNGDNRALVRFDQAAMQSAVGGGTVLAANLRLTITGNSNNWGATGRTVDVHRLLTDWAEGNGTQGSRGTGAGTTWNCAVDSQIANQAKGCSGPNEWEMGQPNNPSVHPWTQAPTATQTITNGQLGVVEYDVTTDVALFLSSTSSNYGWIVRKTNEGQTGTVSFGTKESAAVAQLVITYNPAPPPPPAVTTRVFPTSTSQMSVAIDGPHGYVASYNDYEVVKVRLADGVTLGRFPVGGSFPISLTLLNGDLYVANYGTSAVVRMRTFDGAILATYPTDDHPGTIAAFFGKLWVGNWDNGVLRAIDPATGTTACTYSGGTAHLGVTADEQYIYTTDAALPGIRAIDPTTCQEVATNNITLSSYPGGENAIGFDGTYLWSTLISENKAVRINRSTHTVQDTFTITGAPVGVVFDGFSAWVLQLDGQSITRLYQSDGTFIETLAVNGQPHRAHSTTNQILISVGLSPNTLLIEIG